MFIFDIKLQTKSTFKFFPTSVAKPVRFFASALNWMHPFDMLIQITFETSVITILCNCRYVSVALWAPLLRQIYLVIK